MQKFKKFARKLIAGLLWSSISFPVSAQNPGVEVKTLRLPTGIEIEYAEKGNSTGIPVLFLHGYTDSWHSFEHILPLMPDSFHCIALSQRGHGNSSKPKKGYHPKNFAADVAAFIKLKHLKPCIIVGHSMGGVIAQQFALDRPDLTRALVIASSDFAFADNPGVPDFVNEVMNLSEPIEYAFVEAFQKSTATKNVDSASLRTWIAESSKVPLYVWQQTITELMKVNYEPRLQEIKVPALILWGSTDSYCPRTDQDKFIRKLKKARLLVYEGTGHALHWEEPRRFVNDITDFISTHFNQH